MAQPPDIAALQSILSSALVSTTRAVAELCAEDLAFHRQLDPQVSQRLDRQNARLLDLAERLIRNAVVERGDDEVKLKAEDEDVKELVDGQWGKIVDVVDGLLERADASLDEYTGAVKRGQVQQGADTTPQAQAVAKAGAAPKINVLRQQDMPKPQLHFDVPPQNQPKGLWTPLLKQKPHASVSLENSLLVTTSTDDDGQEYEHYAHPYTAEIAAYEYPAHVQTVTEPIPPLDWPSTTATFVDTIEGVHEMLAELKQASEIAVDLEHHDYRTYIGLTSLMQISTRSKDYIVDTLKPWRQELQILNEVFADSSILKVLHGSSMDMIWLQRDLGIYVVGLFDTYHACRALHYPRAGLDFLLSKFVNFQAQKKYQRADWRIRPLPEELFDYARSDTHFLLYIYDRMRNELIQGSTAENDLLKYVLDHSKEEALQHYEYFVYNQDGTGPISWMRPLLSTPAMLSKEQFSVFKATHAWRDQVAREEDESTPFVMPNHAVFAVARNMPIDKAGLFGTLQGVSLPVRLRADELVSIIKKAKDDGEDGPELNEALGIHLGKRKRAEPDNSVGSAVKRVQLESQRQSNSAAEKPKVQSSISTPELTHVRAEASSFWGSALPTGVRTTLTAIAGAASATRDAIVQLALPLPHLTAQVFADPSGPAASDDSIVLAHPASTAEHAYIRSEERKRADIGNDDDVFVVRQAGGKKRKHRDVETEIPQDGVEAIEPVESGANGIDYGLDRSQPSASVDAPQLSKKARKRARKREQERLAALSSGGNSVIRSPLAAGLGTDADEVKVDDVDYDDDGEDGVFDYANAPSILHPAHEADGMSRKKKKVDKGFDPYQKALNAPKGLPKKQKDSGGRSRTFAK